MERLDAVGPWLVAGTGGTARAVAAAARETSTTFLLQSRDPARAQDFVKWARNFGADAHADDGRQVGTAINTTPLGLHRGDAEPVAAERLTGCAVALDLVYGPGGTEWSRGCHERGMRVSDGRTVLVGQGMRAFQRFFPGHDPPGEVMAAAVNRELESE